MKKPHEILHALATGPERRRRWLTPVGLVLVSAFLLMFVVAGLYTDQALSLPPLLPGTTGVLIGLAVLAAGLALWIWCTLLFRKAHGTPVPFNPPRGLVIGGPYAHVRNPMAIGVFTTLLGVGFLLHSFALAFVWTPVAFAVHAISVKWLEEPELELRFGESYREYKRRVPMFIPKAGPDR